MSDPMTDKFYEDQYKEERMDIIGQNGNDGLHYATVLPTDYQKYIHTSRYARWNDELKRRETWEETVDRYMEFFKGRCSLDSRDYDDIRRHILNLEVMPSMRALMTAGKALEQDNVAGFNCSYIPVDHPKAFDEAMYILMCGTGVGFSVESHYIKQLPEIAEELHETDTCIVVADSKIGWASAYRELLALLYSGKIPTWDTHKIRPKGARLKTFGGRASGPEPLEDLFQFTVEVFKNAVGRKLTTLECHDIMCKVADIVVVGGVRRSALISLSDVNDDRMRTAKSGQWWIENPQRALSNNSCAYEEKPDTQTFLKEWSALYESRSGERGIFNRQAARNQAARSGRRDIEHDFGTNPCSEIVLRGKQFCNLSEVVIRHNDSFDDLKRKVRIAAILGTLQATLTGFRYLRKEWQRNTEEEALLGVSLTGIMDHPVLSGQKDTEWPHEWDGSLDIVLKELKEVAIETNREWASKLGINPATAITCVKPSGTVSQLVNSSSGIHPRYADYYIRTVRSDKKDPLAQAMVAAGYPVEDAFKNPEVLVFSFPMKSPDNSVLRNDMSAIEQLKLWKIYQDYWCEHKPSITVYVKEDEWLEVGAWVYENFNSISGVSFLPHTEHSYKQAPYQEISEEEYNSLSKEVQDKSFEDVLKVLGTFETEDMTVNTKELACTAGMCDI